MRPSSTTRSLVALAALLLTASSVAAQPAAGCPDALAARAACAAPDRFTFQTPQHRQKVAFRSEHEIEWTSPAGAPAGDVRLDLVFISIDEDGVRHETSIAQEVTENDGSFTWEFTQKAPYGKYYFTIVSVADSAYYGRGPNFRIDYHEITEPAGGEVWTEGETRTVRWVHPSSGVPDRDVSVYLRRPGGPLVPIVLRTADDGEHTFTVPAGLPTASDYRILTKLRRYSGEVHRASSLPITIQGTGAQPPLAVTTHFAVPTSVSAYEATVSVVAPHLPDGAEVGVFAGDQIVGAGVVGDGRAVVAVAAEIEDGTPLALRAFVGGTERALPVVAVRDEDDPDPPAARALAFVDGGSFVVQTGAMATANAAVFATVHPNPVASAATVRFTLPEAAPVSVGVYDVLGRRVATLLDGPAPAGVNEVAVPSGSLPAGAYVVRVASAGASASARFTVVR